MGRDRSLINFGLRAVQRVAGQGAVVNLAFAATGVVRVLAGEDSRRPKTVAAFSELVALKPTLTPAPVNARTAGLGLL